MLKKAFEKMNYPCLLLLIYSVVRLRNLYFCIANITFAFRGVGPFFSWLIGLICVLLPIGLFVVLMLEKTGKISSSKKWIGILALAIGALDMVDVFRNVSFLIENSSVLSDMYSIVSSSPLFSLGVSLFGGILSIMLGVSLLTNKKTGGAYTAVFIIASIFICYCGIIASFGNPVNLLNVFVFFIYVLALWYLPRLYDENKIATTEITKRKIQVLVGILVAMIALYAIAYFSAESFSPEYYSDGMSASDYIKYNDPELYYDMLERYNSLK